MIRALLVAAALACAPFAACAHSLSVAHLDVRMQGDGRAAVELDIAIRDLALSLPIDGNLDEVVTWGELETARPLLEAWVASGLEVTSAAGDCALQPRALRLRRYDDGIYAALQLQAACPSGDITRIGYALLHDRDPLHRALVTHRDRAGRPSTAILTRARPALHPGTEATATFPTFVREGVQHILIGYDHLAFLLSLLLPAALVRRRGAWQPAPGFRRALAHTAAIVTAFTLAHSLTLGMAALGWIAPAARWVEVAIAGSVVLAALNNLRPFATRRLWVLAAGFGLVHGLGFAGALSEVGLPPGKQLIALLAFNVGVEAGQLAIVAVALPVLFVLRRTTWYARLALPAASLALALAGGYWILDRLAG